MVPVTCLDKMGPRPLFEAFVCRVGKVSLCGEQVFFFTCTNDTWHPSIHWTRSFWVKSVKGLVRSAKSLVVASQPQEPPHFLFGLVTWAGCNGGHFLYLCMHLPASSCTLLRVGCELRLPQGLQDHGHPLHMLHPGLTVDDNIIQLGGSICSMRTQHWVHEALKCGRSSKQARRKCDKLVHTIWSGAGNFFLGLCSQGNLGVALG